MQIRDQSYTRQRRIAKELDIFINKLGENKTLEVRRKKAHKLHRVKNPY